MATYTTMTRPFELRDIQTVAHLLLRLFVSHENPCSLLHVGRGLAHAYRDPNYGRYYVAEVDGQVVGVIALKRLAEISVESGYVGWIDDLVVALGFEDEGVGAELVEHLLSQARLLGYSVVRGWIKKNNTRALGFFEKRFSTEPIGSSIEFKLKSCPPQDGQS